MRNPLAPVFFLGASVLLALSPVQASKPAPLREPIKKWVVDFGETHCTASRTYGTEEKPLTLGFRPSASDSVVRLMLVRQGLVLDPRHFDVTVSHGGTTIRATGLRFGSADRKLDVVWINLDRKALEGLGTSGEIAIKGGGVNERFALPQMPAVLASLRTCNDDLRKVWNVEDGAAESRLDTPPIAAKPLPELFSDRDYPHQAIMEGASGTSGMTLLIDETGKLRDCTIDATSGIASLDAAACGMLLDRARFTPARNAAGEAVKSVFSTRIVWRIASY